MHFTGYITILTLLAPLALAAPRPDQGPGGGADDAGTSGGGGADDPPGDDDAGGVEGDPTAGIPAVCADVCNPVADLKNDCIIEFGENTNALTCICTTTTIDIQTLSVECSTCLTGPAAVVDPQAGDIHDLIEQPQKCGF